MPITYHLLLGLFAICWISFLLEMNEIGYTNFNAIGILLFVKMLIALEIYKAIQLRKDKTGGPDS